MLVVGAFIVVGGLWLVVTGLLVRSELLTARADVHQLRDEVARGQLTQARITLADLRRHAHRAELLSSGPAWAFAAQLPAGGEPIESVRGIADSVDSLAQHTLPALLDARTNLDPAALRRPDGSINVAPIKAVAPTLAAADRAIDAATRKVSGLPADTWLSPVDTARADILQQLHAIRGTVRSADLGARILPPMLGDTGVKRYFVGFQNPAEARGTGGLPGAFGIVQVDHGKVKFLRFENDTRLGRVVTGLNLGAAFKQLYEGYEATDVYVNSNPSPNFPYAARIWTAMWQKVSGQRLDGAVAVDPVMLSYLLGPTGSVRLHDGTVVDAGNVVPLTLSTSYSRFHAAAERKKFLLEIARAVSTHIVTSHAAASSLVDAADRSLAERRIQVWSADPQVEADLAKTAAGATVPQTSRPYVGAFLTNEAENKLDYYLSGTVNWQRSGCGSTRSVTVTVSLTNSAPASGLPLYVRYRGDRPPGSVRPGDTRDYLSYAATQGGALESVTVDGQQQLVSAGAERGHPVYTVDVELPRGRTRTIVFHLTEPAGRGTPIVLHQPLVHPLVVTVDDAHC